MSKSLLPLLTLVSLMACGPEDPTAPTDRGPTNDGDSLGLEDDLVAQGARVAVQSDAEEAALAVTMALTAAFSEPESQDVADDGELDARGVPDDRCVSVAFLDRVLTLTFEGCERLDGSLSITGQRGDASLTFEDDFRIDGEDLDGTLVFEVDVRGGEYAFDGEVSYKGVDLDAAIDLAVGNGIAMHGGVEVSRDEGSASVVVGSEAAPLTFERGCLCPASGTLATAASGELENVLVDLDLVILPADGEDDYPAFVVPVPATPVSSSLEATFGPVCGDVAVAAEADDFTLEIATADVEAELEAACAEGLVEEDDCARAERRLGNLAETVRVFVPAQALAEDVEQGMQTVLDEVCGLI